MLFDGALLMETELDVRWGPRLKERGAIQNEGEGKLPFPKTSFEPRAGGWRMPFAGRPPISSRSLGLLLLRNLPSPSRNCAYLVAPPAPASPRALCFLFLLNEYDSPPTTPPHPRRGSLLATLPRAPRLPARRRLWCHSPATIPRNLLGCHRRSYQASARRLLAAAASGAAAAEDGGAVGRGSAAAGSA